MASRRHLVFVLAAVLPSMGAAFRTTNFIVEAPTPQIAQQIGQAAEQYRREKALQWLGREMPAWTQPCPIRVHVTPGGAGGATSFAFDNGRILEQNMHIEGSLDRLVASVLPHEVTHTVFAHYFRTPVPRWADEGGAVLSEDDLERNRHDMLVRQILNAGREIPLRRLFNLRDYPQEVMSLYAEGFSVAQFLVDRSNRPTFLAFVATGMGPQGWDNAVRSYYRLNSVEELEQAWRTQLRATRRQPTQLARNAVPGGEQNQGVLVRQTIPPAQPVLNAPVYRGQMPGPEQLGQRFGDPGSQGTSGRPGYLPDYTSGQAAARPIDNVPIPAGQDGWQPAGSPLSRPSAVRLGPPQFAPSAQAPAPNPPGFSPIGYPD